MSPFRWWPWGHREPSPQAAAEAEDAERELNESLRRKSARAVEAEHHLNIARALRSVTAHNNFAEHIEAAYRRAP